MLLRKPSDGGMPIKTQLLFEKQKGTTSITVGNLSGWNKGSRQDFVMCKYDSENKPIPGSVSTWIGIPSDNGVIHELELTGGNDQLYPAGTHVVASATSRWANDLIEAMLAVHDDDGTLKDKVVDLAKINGGTKAGVLTTDENGNVETKEKIGADKIDFATLPPDGPWRVRDFGSFKEYTAVDILPETSISGGGTGLTRKMTYPTGVTKNDLLSGEARFEATLTASGSGWDRMLGTFSLSDTGVQGSVYIAYSSTLTVREGRYHYRIIK